MLGVVALIALGSPAAATPTKEMISSEERDESSTAATVALRFNWPAKFEAKVAHVRRVVGGKRPGTARATFTMSGRKVGREYRITSSDWRSPASVGPKSEKDLRTMSLLVDFVGEDGAYLRQEGADEMFVASQGLLGMEGASAQEKKKKSALLAEVTRVESQRLWNYLVEAWAGGKLEVGKEYEAETVAPVPLVPSMTVPSTCRSQAVRRLPCVDGQVAPRCVELRLRCESKTDQLGGFIRGVGNRLNSTPVPEDILARAKELQTVSESTLITEPDTLVPHRLDFSVRVTMAFEASEAGVPKSLEGSDRSEYVFRYPN